ncbi:hypothetical protein [Allomuricauda sp. SCSIO 65647]|uniref:hypothetical protein n=1 Tax=Allomuricauda sp. SCSIO 65647 TaxID=2908843 RepID=UPI001F39B383|nr:hypothetical protein [Muricauda sp. SCSIO 65647]UJH66079.1 hypothetical protein L0P89_08835 [Muricauda sp. SCSIO 65647]
MGTEKFKLTILIAVIFTFSLTSCKEDRIAANEACVSAWNACKNKCPEYPDCDYPGLDATPEELNAFNECLLGIKIREDCLESCDEALVECLTTPLQEN